MDSPKLKKEDIVPGVKLNGSIWPTRDDQFIGKLFTEQSCPQLIDKTSIVASLVVDRSLSAQLPIPRQGAIDWPEQAFLARELTWWLGQQPPAWGAPLTASPARLFANLVGDFPRWRNTRTVMSWAASSGMFNDRPVNCFQHRKPTDKAR